MQTRKTLGRGLDSLIPSTDTSVMPTDMIKPFSGYKTAPVESIVPNRFQPRKFFDEDKIRELSASIKEQGVIQPLIVTKAAGNKYELIAGERRLRAAKLAGLTEVPIVVKNVDSETMLEQSIIENVQREDLNPIEEAMGYKELIDQFGYKQEDVAEMIGKSRVAVANSLRLLNLPQVIQEDVASGRMSAGHARALLGVNNHQDLLSFREKVLNRLLTVRDVERMVQGLDGKKPTKRQAAVLTPQIKHLVDELTKSLGTKVRLEPDRNKKGGRLVVEYYSPQDLDRIYNVIVR